MPVAPCPGAAGRGRRRRQHLRRPGEQRQFYHRHTREQGHAGLHAILKKFVQRSSGIFGATGTGKSFLTRIILAGLIQYNKASVLIFDMHNEYGFDDTASDTNQRVPGLRSKFPGKVRVVGLGATASCAAKSPISTSRSPKATSTPEDIEMLTRELNLKETTPTTLDALLHTFGQRPGSASSRRCSVGAIDRDRGRQENPCPRQRGGLGQRGGVNAMAAEGLHRKLNRVFNLPYMVEKPAADSAGRDHQDAGSRAARGAVLWQTRERPGLPAGHQPAHPPHPRAWEENTNEFRAATSKTGTAPAGHRRRRGTQAAQPRDGRPDHLQHHRPRDAQVLRHPADHRPAPLADLRRGHVAARHAHLRLAGR